MQTSRLLPALGNLNGKCLGVWDVVSDNVHSLFRVMKNCHPPVQDGFKSLQLLL
jgi:hypothetical protein